MRVFAIILALLTLCAMAQADIVSVSTSIHPTKLVPGNDFELRLKVSIQDSYHINAGTAEYDVPVEVKMAPVEGINWAAPKYPAPIMKKLSFAQEEIPVYENTITIVQKGRLAKTANKSPLTFKGSLHYQGCDDNTCFPPKSISFASIANIAAPESASASEVAKSEPAATALSVPEPTKNAEDEIVSEPGQADIHENEVEEVDTETDEPLTEVSSSEPEETENSIAALIEKWGLPVTFLFIFSSGIALTFTPCVFPMLPIVVGWFMVQGAGKRGKVTAMAALYVLGLALTYAILGLSASAAGAMLGAALQHPAALIVVAVVLVALSLSMFGLFEIRPPAFIANRSGSREGLIGALIMGAFFGIVAAPCVGPFVLSLLLYVGQLGQKLLGFWMFFTLALGLGVPFFVLAVFSGKLGALPAAGMWMLSVKKVFGIVLLGLAIYFLRPLMSDQLAAYIFAAYLILSGFYLGWFEKSMRQLATLKSIRPLLGIILIAVGVWSLIPSKSEGVQFVPYSTSVLEDAKASAKPVIMDFAADWCKPCKKMESDTFANLAVQKEGKRFIWVKVDLTHTGSTDIESIKTHYKVKGVPTVVLIGSDGEEKDRIVGYVGSRRFLDSIKAVK